MKKSLTLIISLIMSLSLSLNCMAATVDTNKQSNLTDTQDDQTKDNTKNTANTQNTSNTSTDTANFKLHTGYNDMFMHYTRYLNMKVGEKTKIYIYIPEKLYEGAKVTEITNNFPYYVTYSGDGTVEALKSIGYGRCLKIHTTVYLPKEDRYEHFTTKIHTYN